MSEQMEDPLKIFKRNLRVNEILGMSFGNEVEGND